MRALLMVGGEGRRLRPLTSDTPKPLLQVGPHTILDHALLLLRRYGISDVTLAVNYLAASIEQHVGTGAQFGMHVSYVRESQPLGTAGALSLLRDFDEVVLMMNGDIVTDINIAAMLEVHRAHAPAMTVSSKVLYTDLSLGVLELGEDGLLKNYCEKPRIAQRFSIGVYLVEPYIRRYLGNAERLDVPELINRLLAAGEKVACYDHQGEWIDIGLPEDYANVQEKMRESSHVTSNVA